MTRDWSNLPTDMIQLIFERVQFIPDIHRFASVCLSWRSVALGSCHPLNPLLVLSYEQDSETCNLYDPGNNKAFKLHLPELHSKWCIGSSNGWLTTVDDDLVIRLLHPFSRAQVSLPPFTPLSPVSAELREDLIEVIPGSGYWKCYFARKLIVSNNNPDSVFVKIGRRGKVSFCRATDKAWTVLKSWGRYSDAIYYEGRIYVANSGSISFCDITSDTLISTYVNPPYRRIPECERMGYLVETSEGLLTVVRHFKHMSSFDDRDQEPDEEEEEEEEIVLLTFGFDVFKYTQQQETWERVTCLGDLALFVGRHQSFSISVTGFPGYKANHIYFTDDSGGGLDYNDTGKFNMENGIVTFYDLRDDLKIHWPPIWFKPH